MTLKEKWKQTNLSDFDIYNKVTDSPCYIHNKNGIHTNVIMKNFIEMQIEMLKKAIQDGVIAKDSSLIEDQKEGIVQIIIKFYEIMGLPVNSTQIGAEVDKRFAEEFD